MTKLKKIFEPIDINGIQIKNRLVVSAMVTEFCNSDGLANERFISYHEEKAQGGWGLIIPENYTIAKGVGAYAALPGIYNEEQVKSHRELTDRIHKAGAKIACQIYHAGCQVNPKATGVHPVGPSAVPYANSWEMPHPLAREEIEELILLFADAAERVKNAGFDAVEIHGAHGYLIHTFVSPLFNKRTDEYGGDIVGRCKFSVEIVKKVREKVGPDFPIIYRMSAVDYIEGGLEIEEAKVLARLLEEAGVNLLHVSQGTISTVKNSVSGSAIQPSSHEAKGLFANNAAEIKSVVNIPVIAVGRINHPELAEEILASGKADMVTMAKASVADPELPNKAFANDIEDIRLCIGCMQGCTRGCTVNPRIGYERKYPKIKAEKKKTVFVVGGGISGASAAIGAAERGHEVILIEKSDMLGGQWNLACVPPGKTDFATLVQWQKMHMEKIGVHIMLNAELTCELVEKYKPEAIIMATGSEPLIPNIPGIENPMVVTAHDILKGKIRAGHNVLIIGGGSVGAETAELLSISGAEVTIVEMQNAIAKDAMPRTRTPLLQRLKKNNVNLVVGTKVLEIKENSVLAENQFGIIEIENIDTVVLALGIKQVSINYSFLGNYNGTIVKCGDANTRKDGKYNIWDGYEVGYFI